MLHHSPQEQKQKKIAWRLFAFGVVLCLVAALSSSCRRDKPPEIILCIGDGLGGADCRIPGKPETVYWPPSELENAWITTQHEMARFAAWCYGVSEKTADKFAEERRARIKPE